MSLQVPLKTFYINGIKCHAVVTGRFTNMKQTNKQFLAAPTSIVFKKACELAGIPATARQAGKWRQQPARGKANRFRNQAKEVLAQEQRDLEQK